MGRHLIFVLIAALTLATVEAEPMTSELFDKFFPSRNPFYTFDAFVQAAAAFPEFGNAGGSTYEKRELAAFFANVQQETGGLVYIEENDQSSDHCDPSFPCPSGVKYYGRGPLQISWNFNYLAAGNALGLDLINHPEILATDAVLSFKASLWFWTNARTPTCHSVITGGWKPSLEDVAANRVPGFGATIDLINGGIECDKGFETEGARNRILAYNRMSRMLGVHPGINLTCADMKAFS